MAERAPGQEWALLTRWLSALPAGIQLIAAPEAGRRLLDRWNEPHRRYHTAAHLTAMLDTIDQHAALADRPQAVRLAAWFHDAVYDPRAKDNEESSAALAMRTLNALGAPEALWAEVARLVLLTAAHDVADEDNDGALLVDADLTILAAPPEEYDGYAVGVRAEYRRVPDELFRVGRATVLMGLARIPTLYRILPDRDIMRRRAHSNILRELEALESAAPS